jgi:hypothetical protein
MDPGPDFFKTLQSVKSSRLISREFQCTEGVSNKITVKDLISILPLDKSNLFKTPESLIILGNFECKLPEPEPEESNYILETLLVDDDTNDNDAVDERPMTINNKNNSTIKNSRNSLYVNSHNHNYKVTNDNDAVDERPMTINNKNNSTIKNSSNILYKKVNEQKKTKSGVHRSSVA